MPVTFTFYTIAERKPKSGEDIIFLKPTQSFGYDGFEPKECTVEYVYIDSDGTEYCERCNDSDLEKILLDNYVADENILWISVDEYWSCFANQP